jgi:hypothetical protein
MLDNHVYTEVDVTSVIDADVVTHNCLTLQDHNVFLIGALEDYLQLLPYPSPIFSVFNLPG